MSRLSSIYKPGVLNTRRPPQGSHIDVFPLLDSKEITVCLQSCDFTITEELVNKPTTQFVRTLLEQFLDAFMGISVTALQKRARLISREASLMTSQDDKLLNGKNGVEEEDEEEEEADTASAFNLIVIHRTAHKFFQGCGIYDLTIMDIMRPDSFRTRRLLSAVVNFAKFREEHSTECEQLVFECEKSLEAFKKAQAENEKIKDKLENLKAQLENSDGTKKKATLKQVNLYNSKIENELKKLTKTQEILILEHTQYRDEKSKLIERLKEQNLLIMDSTKDLEKLREYSSTELIDLKDSISELKNQVNQLQETYNKFEQRDNNITITIDSIQSVENELKNLFRILEEILNDLIKEKNASEKLTANQEYLDQQDIEDKDLSRHIRQIERQLSNTQEKIDKLKTQAEERITKSQQQLAKYRSDYTKLAEERNSKELEYNKKKELIAEIEAKMNKKKADFQVEVRNLNLKLARLNVQIKIYLDEVGKKVFQG